MILYVDAHCHADGYSPEVIKRFINESKIAIVGVGMDLESSVKIVDYSRISNYFIPCIGIHPWNVDKVSEKDVDAVLSLSAKVNCLGEVGLDTKFVPQTIDKQKRIFKRFLEVASERNMIMNIHSVGTWEEILNLLREYNIERAVFHWYSGPQHLLKEIEGQGYFITINPSVRFQRKHRMILERAPLDMILTESDGPYLYRGVNLSPELIPLLAEEIASVKNIDHKEVRKIILRNFQKLFL